MNNLLIAERKIEIERLRKLWEQIKELNINFGLSQSTLDEIQAKISSRLAFCERSIRDNSK